MEVVPQQVAMEVMDQLPWVHFRTVDGAATRSLTVDVVAMPRTAVIHPCLLQFQVVAAARPRPPAEKAAMGMPAEERAGRLAQLEARPALVETAADRRWPAMAELPTQRWAPLVLVCWTMETRETNCGKSRAAAQRTA